MALRTIRTDPDPILQKKCREVTEVNDSVRLLLEDMLDTLHHTPNGAAIAAPQVGILRRLVVIDAGEISGGILKLVNPVIVKQEGEQVCTEGCLSFPNELFHTLRPEWVVVEALDEWGKPIRLEGRGFMAKCFCHEIDHLNGMTARDRQEQFEQQKQNSR